MIRYGYACLNMTLGKQGGFRSFIKKTYDERGVALASEVAVENTERLCNIIAWNRDNGFPIYRMSSNLFPWSTEYRLEDLQGWPQIRANLERAGRLAREGGVRLSFHPGQFNVLSSPREDVVEKSIAELNFHGWLMDVMGLPDTHEAKINIHVGGAFGEKEAALDRFCANVARLAPTTCSRLTVENDDRKGMFTVRDLAEGVSSRTGVPVVMDFHHASIHRSEGLSEEQELRLAASTWPVGIRPVTHYAESARDREGTKTGVAAHSKFVDGPVPHYGIAHDCVVEAKMKEQAVLQMLGKAYFEEAA